MKRLPKSKKNNAQAKGKTNATEKHKNDENIKETSKKVKQNKSKNHGKVTKNKRNKANKLRIKVKEMLVETNKEPNKNAKKPVDSLRAKMLDKLKGARFRYINEELYTIKGKDAMKIFKKDPDAFEAYHAGYRHQVAAWPINPVDIVIKSLKKRPKTEVIADFGCGEAKIAESLPNKVHSFDLVASNQNVVVCDMANVPLGNSSVDVVVFCLSLMGTNLRDYLFEASRVLKTRGLMKIVDIESRFESIDVFIKDVEKFGFTKLNKDFSHKMFYFLDFKKNRDLKNKNKMPEIALKPCLYKKR